jgi:hypothetical protein
MSSRPTTPPSADCAPPSSTASSHSEANPKAGNARSNACSPVNQTCRLQRRSLYAYLGDALTAKARGDPISALA